MTKKELKDIIEKYQSAESDVINLDSEFGINIWNSKNENFYNKLNYVIFKLFETIYGNKGRELIENYLFEPTNITFDELYENLENHGW